MSPAIAHNYANGGECGATGDGAGADYCTEGRVDITSDSDE